MMMFLILIGSLFLLNILEFCILFEQEFGFEGQTPLLLSSDNISFRNYFDVVYVKKCYKYLQGYIVFVV